MASTGHRRLWIFKLLIGVLVLSLAVAFCFLTSLFGSMQLQSTAVDHPENTSDFSTGRRLSYALSGSSHDDVIRLDFVPRRDRPLSDCDMLFVGTPAATFNMSSDFWSNYTSFDAAVKRATADGTKGEGHSMQTTKMYRALHYLASRPHVRQVCETGFNMGHSSFNFLTANRQTRVQSFDIGLHRYTGDMINYLTSLYPERLSVQLGNSTETIPNFIRANPEFRCDLIYVDGGHTYPVAVSDLVHLMSIARDELTIVVFDDYPSYMFPKSFGVAWEDVRRWGYVRELMRCSFRRTNHYRGFVIGQVVERPQPSTSSPAETNGQ